MEPTQNVTEMTGGMSFDFSSVIPLAIKPSFLQTFMARSGSVLPPQKRRSGLRVVENVGIIDIKGAMEKHSSVWSMLFGELAYEDIQEQLRDALAREDITTVLLNIDSPGGVVFGIDETLALIQAVDKKKPVVAYGCGDVCSAAYALASAARKLIVSESTEVGSIGVITGHVDTSVAEKNMGVKFTEITAGEFKRIASQHAPLTDKGRAYLQAMVDRHMSNFKAWVREGRDMSDEELAAVANGKIFIGEDALSLKLVDGISTYDSVLSNMIKVVEPNPAHNLFTGGQSNMAFEGPITMELLKQHAPELLAQLHSEAAKVTETAVTAERTRVQKIMGFAPAGFEKEVQEMCFTAPITAADAAEKFLTLAKERGASLLVAMKEDAPAPVAPTSADTATAESDDAILLAATAAQNEKIALKYGLSSAAK